MIRTTVSRLALTIACLAAFSLAACAPPAAPTPAPAKAAPPTVPALKAEATTPASTPKPDVKAVEDFYRGKTVKIIVATTPGALFDVWGRLLARHMPRYIPGNPNMVVENMPGAGHLIAANHLFNVAPKDGTVIGTFVEAQVINQLTGGKGVEFDMARFQWIGAVSGSNLACLTRTDIGARVSDIRDMVRPDAPEAVFASTGPGSTGHDYALLIKELLGARLKLVSGYPGNQEVRLAIEKGEAEGYCATWDAVRRGVQPWIEAGKPPYKIILQEGHSRHPDIKDVPMTTELAKSEEDRVLFRIMHGPNDYAKPYAAPPGTPTDRVDALRQAFMAAMRDPELVAEANKAELDMDPRSGSEVERGFREILNTPKPIAERFAKLMGR